jgi:hypothetical protein
MGRRKNRERVEGQEGQEREHIYRHERAKEGAKAHYSQPVMCSLISPFAAI